MIANMTGVFTSEQKELISDNLRAFTANFGPVRIESDGLGGFYIYMDDSDQWTQYCYSFDYLNGWLWGVVQGTHHRVKPIKNGEE